MHPLEGSLTICVNLCNLWENILSKKFCEFSVFCGRTSPARVSVNSAYSVGEYPQQEVLCRSVKSVGGTLLLRRQGYLCYYLPQPNHLCKSVQSVGEHPQQAVLCRSVQSVGDSTQQEFLCRSVKSVGGPPRQSEICGRIVAKVV